MAGYGSPLVPQIMPDYINGVAQSGGQPWASPPNPAAGPAGNLPANILPSHSLISADSNTPGYPATVAASAFQIAAIATALAINTATSTAGAATLNTLSGRIVTEALTTAVGAFYTMTLTNSNITPTTPFQFDIRSLTNTHVGLAPYSMTLTTGVAVLVFQNQGVLPVNGTMVISFHT